MWTMLITAVALVLVIEGLLPLLAPQHWRRWLSKITAFDDRSMRIAGFCSLLIGLVIMIIVHTNVVVYCTSW